MSKTPGGLWMMSSTPLAAYQGQKAEIKSTQSPTLSCATGHNKVLVSDTGAVAVA